MTEGLPSATAAGEEGLYVYCVVRGDGSRLLGPIGLDGQVVYTVGSGGLHAVVHNCTPCPYHLRDPQVVQGWVLAHQNVVQAASEVFGAVLPMAFDTIVKGRTNDGLPSRPAAELKAWRARNL